MEKCLKKKKKKKIKKKKKKIKKTKLSLQLFLMANLYRINGPIDMRVWKGRRFENILKFDPNLR
jgi:hypothetical protein